MIAINSIGTYLSPSERLTLFPRLGRLYPQGQAMLAKAEDYEQIRAVSEHYSVSLDTDVWAGCIGNVSSRSLRSLVRQRRNQEGFQFEGA